MRLLRPQTSVSYFQVFSITVVMVVSAVSTLFAYSALFAGKIYPGVSVANTDLSGQTEGNAREILEARALSYSSGELVLRYGDRSWRTTPGELGLEVDIDQTIERGYRIGREGNILDRLGQGIESLTRGHRMSPVFTFDRPAQERILARVVAEIDHPAINARLLVDDSGTIRSTPAESGLRLDVDATIATLDRSFEVFSTHEARLVVVEIPADVTEADLAGPKSVAQEMVSQPLLLKDGERSWSVKPTDIANMLVFNPVQGSPGKLVAALDGSKLQSYLDKIASEADVAPKNATIDYVGGRFVIEKSVDGRSIDLQATAGAINRELSRGDHSVALVFNRVGPAITEDDLTGVRAVAQTIIGQPFRVNYQDNSWTLSPTQLADMLTFSKIESDGQPRIVAGLDREDLSRYVDKIAQKVNSKPRDARFNFSNGKLAVSSEAIDGLTVDVEGTVEAIDTLAQTEFRQASLVVKTEKAKVQGSDAANIVIKDLLASASTSYAGGIAARNHNVELATRRLNGVVVPPGEEFSFNAALGPTTLDSGFRIGYGITISGTNAITVESVGGGICQVATTLYHSAFWAGLKIEARQPHLYWIPKYGQPPRGMTGLDATVDDPYTDLRIRNNTGNWIAIQSYTSDWKVYFSIFGVDQGWKVTAEGPYIRNRVEPDTTMIEEEDPSMPEGTSLLIEHAEPGFDSTIIRHTQANGKEIDRYVVNSHYRPSRNVLLVPKKTEPEPTPTPTPTATPAPTETPIPRSTPTPTPGR